MDAFKALVGYTALAIAITYPLVLDLNARFIGQGDVGLYAWNLWWVNKVATEEGLALFHTDYLFHPTGVSLAVRELTLYNSLLGVVLQKVFSLTAAYNLLVLSSVVLSGLGMYLLARYITNSESAPFLAGFAYAFSPYRLIEVNAGHLNLATTQWIPFFVLYAVKSHREGGFRNICIGGFFLLLTSLASWQYMGMAFIYTALYCAYHALLAPEGERKGLKRVIWLTAVGCLLTAPFLAPLVREFLTRDYMRYPLGTFLGASRIYAADAASILLSPALPRPVGGTTGNYIPIGYVVGLFILYLIHAERKVTPWISSKGELIAEYMRKYGTLIVACALAYVIVSYHIFTERYGQGLGCYLQLLAYIACAIAVAYLVKEGKTSFWVFTLLSLYVLSLGPVLKTGGMQCDAPLPYILLYFVPGGSLFRTPYRFYAFATLAASVLFALGFARFVASARRKKMWLVIVFALLLAEYGTTPYVFTSATVPAVYETIKDAPGDSAVLEVPIPPTVYYMENASATYSQPLLAYYQTYHGKPVVGGYVERTPPEALAFIDEASPYCELLNVFSGIGKHECRGEVGSEALREHNIRFVVVHWDLVRSFPHAENDTVQKVAGIVAQLTEKAQPFYDDGAIAAYRIP